MSYMTTKFSGIAHANSITWGPCHYYTLRNGAHECAIEIAHVRSERIHEVFAGGIVEATSGCVYATTSAIPDGIDE